jgi:hypothetical protein
MEITTAGLNSDSWSADLNDYDYSIFLLPQWIESLREDNQQTLYLDFYSNGSLIAKISGLACHSRFTFQSKLLFYAGPAIKRNLPSETIDQCILALANYAKANKYCRLVVLSYDYRHVSTLSKDLGFAERSEYIVDLTQDKEKLLSCFAKDVKRRTRVAQKNEFVFKETDSPEMSVKLIQLMQETRRIRLDKGYMDYDFFYLPGFKLKTFENLIRNKIIHFYYAEKNSEIFVVQAVMQHNRKAYALLIGVNAEGYRNGLPSFVDYHLILSLKEKNYEYIDFGGIPIDKSHKGLVHFKKSIGAITHTSTYGSTNFLIFPYTLLNPVIRRLRKMPENRIMNYLKRLI